jgi:enoyl-CoA hydratase
VTTDAIRVEIVDGLAGIRMDDDKANAFSMALLDALSSALDRAEHAAKAVVLIGRPDRFSGGFDLGVMSQGGDAMGRLVTAGGRLALRLYDFPMPVVIGCTGHALAMGAVLLLAGDLRIGAQGAYKIGLNEVAIGLALPTFAAELARERISLRHLQRATALASVYDPAGAVDAGFLDRTAPPAELEREALAAARELAALHVGAHRLTKRTLRARAIETIRTSLG